MRQTINTDILKEAVYETDELIIISEDLRRKVLKKKVINYEQFENTLDEIWLSDLEPFSSKVIKIVKPLIAKNILLSLYYQNTPSVRFQLSRVQRSQYDSIIEDIGDYEEQWEDLKKEISSYISYSKGDFTKKLLNNPKRKRK